jgi:hypothetical protein
VEVNEKVVVEGEVVAKALGNLEVGEAEEGVHWGLLEVGYRSVRLWKAVPGQVGVEVEERNGVVEFGMVLLENTTLILIEMRIEMRIERGIRGGWLVVVGFWSRSIYDDVARHPLTDFYHHH